MNYKGRESADAWLEAASKFETDQSYREELLKKSRLKLIIKWPVAALVGCSATLCVRLAEASVPSGALSFQEWKAAKVEEAKGAVSRRGVDARSNHQAHLDLEIASELALSDYFTLYVAQIKDRATLNEIAKKLSSEQVAALMLAYQKQLANATTSDQQLPLPGFSRPTNDLNKSSATSSKKPIAPTQ